MGVTQQRDTPQRLDIYQINAGVFFPVMHITQFVNIWLIFTEQVTF